MAPKLDTIVAQIQAATSIADIQKHIVPTLRKLDKQAATAQAGSTRGGSASSSKPPAPASPGPGEAAESSSAQAPAHVLATTLADGRDPLSVLDPHKNTVGYLFVLNARLSGDDLRSQDIELLMSCVLALSEAADPAQLRLVPDQLVHLVRQFASVAESSRALALAVLPIKNLIQKSVSHGYLSPLHPLLMQIALSARSYNPVHDIVMTNIVDIDTGLTAVRYHDNLLYHYLGGVIAALLGEHTRAMDMLEIASQSPEDIFWEKADILSRWQVVVSPAQVTAAIQVDAYKKLILLQLLTHGHTEPLPKYTSATVASTCKDLSGPYLDFAEAFATRDATKVTAAFQQHHQTFEQDLNAGLVDLCWSTFRRRAILRLTETFITLSLREIAKAMQVDSDEQGLQQARAEVVGMIERGEVRGTLSGETLHDMSVTFTDDPDPLNSHATVANVTRAIHQASVLDQHLLAHDWQISASKDFVQKAYAAASSLQPMQMATDDYDGSAAGEDWRESGDDDDDEK
ncbi:hypothetical protein OIV83_004956 [Microbotryomycetes sp. JL201]|nr:hypothetical protein OIV83_004956 [Microbotryomycetes sp. JL201]